FIQEAAGTGADRNAAHVGEVSVGGFIGVLQLDLGAIQGTCGFHGDTQFGGADRLNGADLRSFDYDLGVLAEAEALNREAAARRNYAAAGQDVGDVDSSP